MPQIQIEDVSISYGSPDAKTTFKAVVGANLAIEPGEFVTIVGPSGCGKSTLLSAIAGLVPYDGRLTINGAAVTGPGPDRAIVFQDASLLPWRTVHGNVRFGLEMQRKPRKFIRERAEHFIEMVGLNAFARYYPGQLSGGMRQRVNIARALAADPQVLLMDEPFGALDAQTREIMGGELLRIWEAERKTAIFVTHDIEEAIFLADRVVVMGRNPGRIKDVIRIDLPRRRTVEMQEEPAFLDLKRRLRAYLAEDLA
ncbi:ABC transporter ATP-binding protein [Acuticoccus mangrovi]|uniref:ABC transporter ATP-binding protein n=1 Tax=Acuticoccus mangrovi TaxID=2796142 RepID=A0A934IQ45_9HYPH|nr:ABC transporter ATP-binding protein [Acuticoccus mangrovi]MBJ3775554.1 ABC transporter ATP-binding protein [Acuticoccus mangrovi]